MVGPEANEILHSSAASSPRPSRAGGLPVQGHSIVIAALSGLVAGLIHVFSGPDHLAAVAPMSVDQRHGGWTTGFRWGLGHASGVILVGVLSLLLRELLPVAWLSSWAERLVGVVLIGIGLWGIRKAFTNRVHTHEHEHDGRSHQHIHVHGPACAHPHREAKAHSHTHAAFAVGTLHGLAGSSHFLGVLPALAFPSRFQAVGYLAAYGVGTVFAMAAFSSLVSLAANKLAFSGARAYRALMAGCSTAAVVIGAYWILA